MRAVLLATALAACAYKPGSFTYTQRQFPGKRTTVGCIDLAVDRRVDLSSGGAVLGFEFGNRCDRPATIDLANAHVLAQMADGTRMEMHPWDPDFEIRELRLDGRTTGAEALAYPANERIDQICIDVASVAHEPGQRWLCFSNPQPPLSVAEVSE